MVCKENNLALSRVADPERIGLYRHHFAGSESESEAYCSGSNLAQVEIININLKK
jgi:hypothetical protein